MKKIMIIIVAIMAISTVAFSQITNVYITKDSSVVIDKVYAGVLSGTMFSTDSLHASGFTGVRFGAMASYQPAKWIAFKTWAMYQAETGSSSWSLQQFWMKLTPTQKLSIEVGSMGTLVTEQRPHPVSGNGQFETWSEASIPGMALNAKVKYDFTSNFQLAGGVALRNNLPEYSGRITYKKVQVSAWYSEWNKKFGTALTLDLPRVYNTFVWKQDQTIANVLVVHIVPSKGISLYSDNGYNFSTKKLVRSETGAMKTFESKWIKGLFGLGYNYENRSVNGYLFIHI